MKLFNAVRTRRPGVVSTVGAAIAGAVLVTLTPAVAMAAPQAETSFSFRSEAGDYVGDGRRRSFTTPSWTFAAGGTNQGVSVQIMSGNEWWYAEFFAPRGETLRPGTYRDVEGGLHTGRAAGMEVHGDGRGCSDVYGQFTIEQIEFDPSGAISVFDAHFVQRCGSATAPRLTGKVRYQAFPLSYKFTSDPGDYIGGGVTKSYTNSTTVFKLIGNTSTGVRLTIDGRRDHWHIELAAPPGEQLKVGTYTNVRFPPIREPGQPGLDVGGNSRGCTVHESSSFSITELVSDPNGEVRGLAASFEQFCNTSGAALRGMIHYYA